MRSDDIVASVSMSWPSRQVLVKPHGCWPDWVLKVTPSIHGWHVRSDVGESVEGISSSYPGRQIDALLQVVWLANDWYVPWGQALQWDNNITIRWNIDLTRKNNKNAPFWISNLKKKVNSNFNWISWFMEWLFLINIKINLIVF